jgi:hypothetical protein
MAWSRHTAWVCKATTLWWRLASMRMMATWSSSSTRRRRRPRSAAIAVDNASFGSFFCALPEPSTRTLDDSIGGTSTTSSPAATSCWASR